MIRLKIRDSEKPYLKTILKTWMRAEYNKMYASQQDEHWEIHQQLEYMSF